MINSVCLPTWTSTKGRKNIAAEFTDMKLRPVGVIGSCVTSPAQSIAAVIDYLHSVREIYERFILFITPPETLTTTCFTHPTRKFYFYVYLQLLSLLMVCMSSVCVGRCSREHSLCGCICEALMRIGSSECV